MKRRIIAGILSIFLSFQMGTFQVSASEISNSVAVSESSELMSSYSEDALLEQSEDDAADSQASASAAEGSVAEEQAPDDSIAGSSQEPHTDSEQSTSAASDEQGEQSDSAVSSSTAESDVADTASTDESDASNSASTDESDSSESAATGESVDADTADSAEEGSSDSAASASTDEDDIVVAAANGRYINGSFYYTDAACHILSGFKDDIKSCEKIEIPDKVTQICDGVFRDAGWLKKVVFNSELRIIGDNAFAGSGLTSVTIPASVTSIGDYAFGSCSSISEVVIESASISPVKKAARYAHPFESCYGITNITFTAKNLKTIPAELFYIDSADDGISLTIPSTVTTISDKAFYNRGFGSLSLPAGVTTIGKQAFYGIGADRITIPSKVISIGQEAFGHSDTLTDVEIASAGLKSSAKVFNGSNNIRNISFTGTKLASIPAELFYTDSWNTTADFAVNVTIPSTVTTIGDGAFHKRAIRALTLPAGLTSIGSNAFYATSLDEITIPSKVKNLGDGAFGYISSLRSVTISSAIIAGNATTQPFNGSDSIEAITFNASKLTTIPAGLFAASSFKRVGESGLTVTIPGTVTAIGENAFYRRDIRTIELPAGLISVGSYAFNETSIASLTIPAKVTTLGQEAFGSIDALESVEIDSSVLKTATKPFAGSCRISDITIRSPKLTAIPAYLFYLDAKQGQPSGGVALHISSPITTIGDYAFTNRKIQSLTIPDTVTTIGKYAYSNIAITSLSVPASVKTIGDGAFKGCSDLESVVFNCTSASFGRSVFDNTGLSTVRVFRGTTADTWAKNYQKNYRKSLKIEYKAKYSKISISKVTSINAGSDRAQTLYADITYSSDDTPGDKVTWKSSDETIATVYPVDDKGDKDTANNTDGIKAKIEGHKKGTVTITAVSATGLKATQKITVYDPITDISFTAHDDTQSSDITVTGQDRNYSSSVNLGQTSRMTITAQEEHNGIGRTSGEVLTWSVKPAGVVTVTGSAKNGTAVVTVKAAGTATITATARDTGKVSSKFTITVNDYRPVVNTSSVTINNVGAASGHNAAVTIEAVPVNGNEIKSIHLASLKKGNTAIPAADLEEYFSFTKDTARGFDWNMTAGSKVAQTAGASETYTAVLAIDTDQGVFKGIPAAFTIKVVNAKPTVTFASVSQGNLFYASDNKMSHSVYRMIASAEVADVTDVTEKGADYKGFELDKYDASEGEVSFKPIGYSQSAAKSFNKTVKLNVTFENGISTVYTVTVAGAAANPVKLTALSQTLYKDSCSSGPMTIVLKNATTGGTFGTSAIPGYINGSSTLTISDTNGALDKAGYKIVDNHNGSFALGFKDSEAAHKSGKFTLTVASSEWVMPMTVALNITYKNAASPVQTQIVPERTSYTVNASADNAYVAPITVKIGANNGLNYVDKNISCETTLADGVLVTPIWNSNNSTLTIRTDETTEEIAVGKIRKQTVRLSYNYVDVRGKNKTATSTITVNYETNISKLVTVTAKGSINTVARDTTCMTLTPSVKYDKTVSVVGMTLAATDIAETNLNEGMDCKIRYDEAFRMQYMSGGTGLLRARYEYDIEGDTTDTPVDIPLYVSDNKNHVYKPVVNVFLSDRSVVSVPVTLKIEYKAPTVSGSATTLTLYKSRNTGRTYNIVRTGSYTSDATIAAVEMADTVVVSKTAKSDEVRSGEIIDYTPSAPGCGTVALADSDKVDRATSARITFNVTYRGQNTADASQKPSVVNLTVKIVK